MNRIWHNAFYPALLIALLLPQAYASLDLLAGVEAGIETDTAMSTIDLDRTQEILSSNDFESEHVWHNDHTGIQYQIKLQRSYSYGHYPCLAYQLKIKNGEDLQEKSLDACQHRSGKWISISPSSMAF
ncbi:MAG: hypothetical protein M1270_07980 [Gammaproteobacteria bacterium]|nr:hypothetical protein [Gammaproteobacteria bacterium]